jgi:antitoxin (DNA-binding transcriptional repressor) of toxin-antitoxin stability system
MLDKAEHGETIVITRAGKQVATLAPATAGTWGVLREAFADWTPIDDEDPEADIAAGREAARADLDEDPWRNA